MRLADVEWDNISVGDKMISASGSGGFVRLKASFGTQLYLSCVWDNGNYSPYVLYPDHCHYIQWIGPDNLKFEQDGNHLHIS